MSVTLKNQHLTAVIEEKGAQLCSVRSPEGLEYIWQADPAIWNRHAPLLFPVIGRLQGGEYTLNGKTYHIGPHGFCRDAMFEVAEQSDTSVSFRLTESEETLAMWPFRFVLTVTFTLEDNRLVKCCRVENPGRETMYFELGSHDGFNAPLAPGETMADYAITIPGLCEMFPYGMDEMCMMMPKDKGIMLPECRIDLKPTSYGLDTIVLDALPQNTARLVDRSGKARVTLDFDDYTYLGLWTQMKDFDTNYVCIEPWSTLPDALFSGRGLDEKAGIRSLEGGQSTTLTYTTTFD